MGVLGVVVTNSQNIPVAGANVKATISVPLINLPFYQGAGVTNGQGYIQFTTPIPLLPLINYVANVSAVSGLSTGSAIISMDNADNGLGSIIITSNPVGAIWAYIMNALYVILYIIAIIIVIGIILWVLEKLGVTKIFSWIMKQLKGTFHNRFIKHEAEEDERPRIRWV